MKFFSTVLRVALLITSVTAGPLASHHLGRREFGRTARGERRTTRSYGPGTSNVIHLNRTVQETYSSNWAGAVLIGAGYTSVSGDVKVPVPQLPRGADPYTTYCASAWVGIDGDTCNTAILQTGINVCIQGGNPSYSAWFEWYPDYAHDFPNVQISAGNQVKMTVNATTKSSGTATVENLSTGVSVIHTFSHGLEGNLCEFNAEWIVEDFSVNNGLAPFADFDTVVFSNAVASAGRHTYGPSSASIMDIYQDLILTSSSVTEDSVTVNYIQT
ncbi:Concanavalin A-like lectin/glucanases superfamily [Penicillium sp. IBT 31633x]|nr:Concanavalin A-like lectin/glucanases superfamily [Penicillium sp. IBT 31633x]